MKRDPVDILLQLAFLEGVITTRGAYEKATAHRKAFISSTPLARQELVNRLGAALEERNTPEDVPVTIGSFLRHVRTDGSIRPKELYQRLGLPQNIYRMLEHDRISPLKISIETWNKLRMLFNLPYDTIEEMIRRTHQLVWYRPMFRTTLARYHARGKSKSAIMEQAATELYTRARLDIPRAEEERLDALLADLRRRGE